MIRAIEMFHDAEGNLVRFSEIKDLGGALEYAKRMVEFHKPRDPKAAYSDKATWYHAKDKLAALKVAIKQFKKAK